ncbi:hypothetical protein [Bifidobacterium breve]|uniref:hypothetical protein n=1 Tax=Bifidobacterium breve TaxID=1685 RepID=UPI0012AB3B0F|nr:hypothetical protein [Bifidobacterium breve]
MTIEKWRTVPFIAKLHSESSPRDGTESRYANENFIESGIAIGAMADTRDNAQNTRNLSSCNPPLLKSPML